MTKIRSFALGMALGIGAFAGLFTTLAMADAPAACKFPWRTAALLLDGQHVEVSNIPVDDAKRMVAVADNIDGAHRMEFQARVGAAYSIRLGTDPKTGLELADVFLVDKAGCLFAESGATPIVNLARWLKGMPSLQGRVTGL